eukprot:6199800-Pleurochrysis_carterae.AAC.3
MRPCANDSAPCVLIPARRERVKTKLIPHLECMQPSEKSLPLCENTVICASASAQVESTAKSRLQLPTARLEGKGWCRLLTSSLDPSALLQDEARLQWLDVHTDLKALAVMPPDPINDRAQSVLSAQRWHDERAEAKAPAERSLDRVAKLGGGRRDAH